LFTPDLTRDLAPRHNSDLVIPSSHDRQRIECVTKTEDDDDELFCRLSVGMGRMNGGTRHLWSLWKPAKLPDRTVAFSPKALRESGWRSVCSSVNRRGQQIALTPPVHEVD
jgi:hypothetical protein